MNVGSLICDDAGKQAIVVPCLDAIPDYMTVMTLDEHDAVSMVITSHRKSFEREWQVSKPAATIGRVVIMADMEGISSVPNDEAAVTPAEETGGLRTSAYSAACRAMTQDVMMAIAGARAAGAQEVLVADSHWYDTNLVEADFDVPVLRGSQAALAAMDGADAAILIGWHSKAGTNGACLPHTYTDRIAKLQIDGREVGEIGMLSQLIASYGTPVILVSGDFAAHLEARSDVRSARSVVTKFVDEHGAVTHRQQLEVWRQLVEQTYQATLALSKVGRNDLLQHKPGQFEVVVHPSYEVEADQESEKIAPGTYRLKGTDIRDSYRVFQRFVDRLPAINVGAA